MHVKLCIQAFMYVHIYVCSTRSTSCQLMHVTHTPCRNTKVLNIRIKYYCYFLNHIIPSLTHGTMRRLTICYVCICIYVYDFFLTALWQWRVLT